MTKVAERSGLARTTVDAIIRRLIDQGLVSRAKVGGHWEYEVGLDDVADKLDWIEQRLRPETDAEYKSGTDVTTVENTEKLLEGEPPMVENDEKVVISGEAAQKVVEREFGLHDGERVRILLARSMSGVDESVARLAKYIEFSAVYQLKLEILACSHVGEALQEKRKCIPLPPNPDLVRLNMVPTAYCKADSDMIIFRDVACIIHVASGTVERVTALNIVEAMKHLLDIASETGWSINMSAWLE
jgi:hypothetical protein